MSTYSAEPHPDHLGCPAGPQLAPDDSVAFEWFGEIRTGVVDAVCQSATVADHAVVSYRILPDDADTVVVAPAADCEDPTETE